jgi:hypothetical protein
MASKRKAPSFEIPSAVKRAGQSGWVYRTEPARGKGRQRRGGRAAARPPAHELVTVVEAVVAPPAPLAVTQARSAVASPNVAARLVGLGLQVAAVPFMVPLYLTAAVSKRLGTTGGQ